MPDAYDLVIIGSGSGAQTVAHRVRAAGQRVAVIDHRPLGGTCALRGCDPKKVLLAGTEAVGLAARLRGLGVDGTPRIDWPQLMVFKRRFTDPVPQRQEDAYAADGIAVVHGHARFTGPAELIVGERRLAAERILLAIGASPIPLGIPGAEHVVTSEDFLALEALPRRIALIGGGYIASEFSHLAARAGAAVTVLQRGPRLLPQFDPDLVGWLTAEMVALGIDVRTESTVCAVERSPDGFVVHARTGETDRTVTADLVVHAAGRAPPLAALDLAAGEVALRDGRLALNDFLQSVSNPRVYAAGDGASSGPPLTPVAAHDAQVVAGNLLEGNRYRPDYRGVPSVAFTDPPIAAVGLSAAAAFQRPKVRVISRHAADWYTARRLNEPVYGFKTLVAEESGEILGAHLVGPHAEEVINLFALAIRHGLTAEALRTTIYSYPTSASDVKYML